MSAPRRGRVIAGKYRLESPLAHGGMGSVWTARHVLLDTRVAIKFIVPSAADTEAVRTRFEREAKAAATLQSPHVVRIYDYGVEAQTPYLVMELLEGQDLSARLAERGRLSVSETVAIVTQVARALRRASEEAIVHRDLKPSNVFIVRSNDEDEDEIVKVLDFGVAKAPRLGVGGDTTKSGTIVGSPRYMSPEQARSSGAADHRSDLWSLAVIAYRALTGHVPFDGDDVADLIVRICTDQPPPPSRFVPTLEPEIDAFFSLALDRNPDKRFQTARALATAFAAAAGEEVALSVGPPSLRAGGVARESVASLPEPPPSRERVDTTRPSLHPHPEGALLDRCPKPPILADPTLAPPAAERGSGPRDGDPSPRSSEPFVLRRRKPSDRTMSTSSDGTHASTRARRVPWYIALRQGLAGAAIATVVVGGAMSLFIWGRSDGRLEAAMSASPPSASACCDGGPAPPASSTRPAFRPLGGRD